MAERVLDLLGLKCPLPALKAAAALRRAEVGDVLVIRCTDPLSAIDIPNMVREVGHRLLDETRDGATLIFRVRREPGPGTGG